MSDDARSTPRSATRVRRPEHSPSEVESALRRLLLRDALFSAAWPGRPLLTPELDRGLASRSAAILSEVGIDLLPSGSFAGTCHGIPRAPRDLDRIVAPDSRSLKRSSAALPEDDCCVGEAAAMDAPGARRPFRVIDLATGRQAGLVVLEVREFSELESSRRQVAGIVGVTVPVGTAEDAIPTELRWARRSASDRRLRDAAGVRQGRGNRLHRVYLDPWAEALGVGDSRREPPRTRRTPAVGGVRLRRG